MKEAGLNLEQDSIRTLQQLMHEGDLNAVGLCEFYLERIEKYDGQGPMLNSILELNPEALEQAEKLDHEPTQNVSLGCRRSGKFKPP